MKNVIGLIVTIIFSSCFMIPDKTQIYNVKLFISCQSSKFTPLEIIVYIDDKEIVNQKILCRDGHNWYKYEINLSNGYHTIKALSKNSDAELNESFKIKGAWDLTLSHWYIFENEGTKKPLHRFHFKVHEEGVVFG